MGSQIESDFFSLVGILTNLKRCHLQSKNLNFLKNEAKISLMILGWVVIHLLVDRID